MRYLAILLVLLLLVGSLIVLNTIYPVLPGVANKTNDIVQGITDNWQGFLFGKKDAEKSPEPEVDKDAELESRIKAEVDKAVAARLAAMGNNTASSSGGLVVVPANQSSTIDSIAKSFSDQVEVRPDASGQSGVILPIFRDGAGQPYLYILTPIKQ